MYSLTRDVVLPIGLTINLDQPDAPPARRVRLRMPTVADEMAAEAERKKLAASTHLQDVQFAEQTGASDVLFLTRLIVSWEGLQVPTWREVYRLYRPDYNALQDAVMSLEVGARAAVAKAEAAGEVAPLSVGAPVSSP